MSKDIFISVQSQKGGVGKTTVALNIASLLLPTHRVLFFDLDIAGTEASSVSDSSLWKYLTHVREFNIENKMSNNIVNLYTSYMHGKSIQTMTWEEKCPNENAQALVSYEDRINIFSSSMECKQNNTIYQHAPQILFDDAHAEWFVDMLEELVISARKEKPVKKTPLAIIFDCSPGYSGLGPYIEDWLTDIGPESAKFVFVASSDQQDILACTYAIKRIEDAYKLKIEAAKCYHTFSNNFNENIASNLENDKAKAFFIKLVELEASRQRLFSYAWYIARDSSKKLSVWKSKLSNTWSLVHNRVPACLTHPLLINQISNIIPDSLAQINGYSDIYAALKFNIDKRVMSYDENYALQFVAPEIIRKVTFKDFKARIQTIKRALDDSISVKSTYTSADEFISHLIRLQNLFITYANKMNSSKDAKIHIEWLEFSPLWLFLKPLHFVSNKKIRKEMGSFEFDGLEERVIKRFRNLRHELFGMSKATRDDWLSDVFLIANAFNDVLTGKITGLSSSALANIGMQVKFLKLVTIYGNVPKYKPWSKEKLIIDSLNFSDDLRERMAEELSSDVLDIVRSNICFVVFEAYNNALAGLESLALIREVSRNSYTDDKNVMYHVLAESIFNHVLYTKDLTLEQGLNFLRGLAKMTDDPRNIISAFNTLHQMAKMTDVLRPILDTYQKDLRNGFLSK